MSGITKQCRSDDIGTLKAVGLDIIENYVLKPDEKVLWMGNKGMYKDKKSTRGFNDIIFGRLICPHKHSDVYAEDPRVYVSIIYGAPKIIY